jgi:hypothetical protein
MRKKILAEIIFWMHFVIFVVWFSLFFVPASIWPKRVVFHFWYIVIFFLSQLITGFLLMKRMHKFRIVCPCTTLMQFIRGYKLGDPKNYDHSFVREFAARLRIKIPYGFIGFLIFVTLGIIIYQYVLYLNM